MMDILKLRDGLLVMLFVVFIVTPGLGMLLGKTDEVSLSEQRKLAPKPLFEPNKQFARKYEAYFNDHFGLRNTLLDWGNVFKTRLFKKSISTKVILGQSGWMYFSADGSLRDFIGEYTPSMTMLESWRLGIEIKRQWLSNLGAEYLLVPIPGKMSIYPEFLPQRIQSVAGVTRLSAFHDYMNGLGEKGSLLDIRALLKQAKNERRVYFKTDTHWNDDGAYLVYRAIMRRLAKKFPEVLDLPVSSIRRVPAVKFGDIAKASRGMVEDGEAVESLQIKTNCGQEELSQLLEFKETGAYQNRPKKLPLIGRCEGRSLKAIVVHDSFGNYMMPFLRSNFKEVIFMHSYDVFLMKSLIQSFQPDVFIDVRVDRRFHYLLEPDQRMSAELSENN